MSWDTRILIDGAYGNLGDVPPVRSAVPRQLPRATPGFTGRAKELAELDALADGDGVVAAIVGTAGSGKTTLAVRWAQQAQGRYPDGTLYVNLRGYDPSAPLMPGDVLCDFLGALGISAERIPPRLDARAALYRSELARRQVLIVLDNARDVAQVRPLVPGGTGCAVLVTSRADLLGLEIGDGARRIALTLFSEQEAVELVRTMLGPRADAEPGAVTALVQACARLPLALRIAAGRAATHPHLTITELVAQLESERWQALSVPADELGAVRTVFDWSYHCLPPQQARMFRLLGLYPGQTIDVHPAAALNDVEPGAARKLLADLAEQHVLEPVAKDRYTWHDLLRAYAADLAEQDEDRVLALGRLVEWSAHHARTAYLILYPDRSGHHAGADIVTSARAEITFAGRADAWAWVESELVNVVSVVRVAARNGFAELTMLLGELASSALGMMGRFDEALEVCRLGLAAAERIGDRRSACWLTQGLGQLYRAVNRWQEAEELFLSTLVLARELVDPVLEAEALSHVGWGQLEKGRYAEALPCLEGSLVLAEELGQTRLTGFDEFCLSQVWSGLGDHEKALRHAERSLIALRRGAVHRSEIYAWYAMARAKQVAGKHAEAVELCERALATTVEHENQRFHALLLASLGESLQHTGDRDRGIECWREALRILDERGDHRASDLRERLAEVSAGAG